MCKATIRSHMGMVIMISLGEEREENEYVSQNGLFIYPCETALTLRFLNPP